MSAEDRGNETGAPSGNEGAPAWRESPVGWAIEKIKRIPPEPVLAEQVENEEARMLVENLRFNKFWEFGFDPESGEMVDPETWPPDFVRKINKALAFAIQEQRELGACWRQYLYMILTGTLKFKGRSRGPVRRIYTQEAIAQVIADVAREYSLSPTRNDEPSEFVEYGPANSNSACDIVADAMASLEKSPSSYGRLKKIYLDHFATPPEVRKLRRRRRHRKRGSDVR